MAEDFIEFDADSALRHLNGAEKDARAQRFAKLIGQRWLAWIAENFKVGGKEKPWKALAPSTVHARKDGSNRPLQNYGNMRQAFTTLQLGPGHVTVGAEVNIDGVDIVSVHERGTGPFTIRPKLKKALAFPYGPGPYRAIKGGPNDGRPGIVTRMVRHPGIPQRKMLPSRRLAEELATETIEKVMAQIAKKANK